MKNIFIFGASGHAKVVVDIIEREVRYGIEFLADDDPSLKGAYVYGYRVIGGKEDLLMQKSNVSGAIVAIGNNSIRMKAAAWLVENGFSLVSAIHPSAQIGRGVTVGKGTVIMAGGVINSDSDIGSNVIINTKASIDHDCQVNDGVHVAPGAILCGSVKVGEGTFLGAGITVIPNITIGKNSVIGAGAVVIRDVPDGVTAVGSPARIIRQF